MTDSIEPGHFFILGFDGPEPNRNFLDLLEEFTPSGIIFLENNYENPTQLKSLIGSFKSILGKKAFFAVDQEPGRVQRLKRGFPRSILPVEYAEGKSLDNFVEWCAETCRIMSDIGINLNFAPVVDLLQPGVKCDVLEGRSFGDDVKVVGKFSAILTEAHKNAGILTCAKHFPGLGSAGSDPHLELAVTDESYERFENYHWKPFRNAVDKGVDSVMTTHLLAKSLDEREPATYSSKVISHLREKMGFLGPVISDDLHMKGAGDTENTDSAVLRSLEAGHDLVIISRDTSIQRKAIGGVRKRLDTDDEFRRISTAHEEIIAKFKEKIRL
jgi:beta-N-acetylhexosaminidase